MEGLLVFPFLIVLVIIILLFVLVNRSAEQRRLMESMYEKIKQLDKKIDALESTKDDPKLIGTDREPRTIIPPNIIPKSQPSLVQPIDAETEAESPKASANIAETLVPTPTTKEVKLPPAITSIEASQRNRKPADLEKFIGENLANKIGIAVLVLGIAFFVKYAIDKNWVNESGRVIIGLLAGGILIGLAHYFRNTYRSFSSVLVGGGLTVFYFSIGFAFHQYHLLGQTAAFIAMVLISASGVLLSIFYNRQELAILATIGGFITPFLVSTGNENYIALFTYLCILNAGLLVLSWFKRWPTINLIGFFFTTIIYAGWLVKRTIWDDVATMPVRDAFLFATLFYLLFIVMNVINTIRLKTKFLAFDFIILLSTNFLYYAAGMIILAHWNESAQGVFTASLGIFNLALAGFFTRKKSVDQNFIGLLTGLAITFISLVAPVQLEGNFIVLFWASEAVILYWLFRKSGIALLRTASMCIVLLLLASLLINWTQVYLNGSVQIPIVINRAFITSLFAAIALFILHRSMRDEVIEKKKEQDFNLPYRKIVLVAAIATVYLSGVLEIYYQFSTRYPGLGVQSIYISLFSFIVTVVLLRLLLKEKIYPSLKFVLTAFCFALYLVGLSNVYALSNALIAKDHRHLFIGHWFSIIVLLWLLYDLVLYFRRNVHSWQSYLPAFTWIAAGGIVLVLSVEMHHVITWTTYKNEVDRLWWQNLYYKAGLSICWGLCSFAMMWLGMKYNFKTLRIISLTLFTITLVKLFASDIRNIPPGGKIAAFILLGVLLLVVSFMYQRLKKIIIDDANSST